MMECHGHHIFDMVMGTGDLCKNRSSMKTKSMCI